MAGFGKSHLASTENFTFNQEEEEEGAELGFNMTAPVGAPSYITSYFPSSLPLIQTADVNDAFQSHWWKFNPIFDFRETKVSEAAYFKELLQHLHRRVGERSVFCNVAVCAGVCGAVPLCSAVAGASFLLSLCAQRCAAPVCVKSLVMFCHLYQKWIYFFSV